MKLPYLEAMEQNVDMITQFGGYNHRISIGNEEFFDMKNMSSKDFPLASTRNKRGYVSISGASKLLNAQAMVAKDNLIIAYTDTGDIGVRVIDDVAKNEWKNPESVETTETSEPEVLYTKITDFVNNDVVNMVLNAGATITDFSTYKQKSEYVIIAAAIGKSPLMRVENEKKALYMQWEHEEIPAGLFWTKSLFNVAYVYIRDDTLVGDGDKTIIAVDNNTFLDTEEKRNKLKNVDLWINGKTKVRITSIEAKNWLWSKGDWKITLDRVDSDNPPSVTQGDDIMVRMTEPLANAIAAGKYEVINEGTQEEEIINQPSRVKVSATTATHVNVLKGKTLNISNNDYHVSDVEVGNDGYYYLMIDCPHEAIQAGATIEGDRLFLCELNPLTGEATISDVFAASAKEHTMLEMGGNVVIFPEKIMVNTHKKNASGQFNDIQLLEAVNVLNNSTLKMTDASGNTYDNVVKGKTAPEDPVNGMAWIDTTENPPTMKVFSSQIEQWAKTQAYCEIHSSSISDEWQVGDAVELQFEEDGIIGDVIVPVNGQKYFVFSQVETSGDDKFVRFPVAMTVNSKTMSSAVTIKRCVPDMDFVIENENRLWGCKYGEVDGEMINEIFACKLGDPKNWHCFSNTSMDSYYVSLGADGEFTGAYSYAGNPFFFREGCVHRIYGNFPSNYSLKTINCHGVEKGSNKGIAVMNDVLFYKSPVGIMAFTGASPVNMTENFGEERYKNAVAGAVGNKMYFSMQDSTGKNVLFAYNDNTRLWHKEDDFRCKELILYDNELYALSGYDQIVSMGGEAGTPETDFDWNLTGGNIGFYTPYHKRLAKINLRLMMDKKTTAKIYIQYDSSGNWHHVTNLASTGKARNVTVPITPQRCDHFAIKLEGHGACKILSVNKHIEEGSDYE